MHMTATAAGIGIAAITGSFFLSHPANPMRADVQAAAVVQTGPGPTGQPARDNSPALDAALRKVIPEVNFEDVPFEQVMAYLAELNDMNVVVRWSELEEQGTARDRPVSLRLRNVSTARVLDIVLDEVGHGAAELKYQVRDDVLIVTTLESIKRDVVTRVYDVRDLLTGGLDWVAAKERATGRAAPAAPADGPGSGAMPGDQPRATVDSPAADGADWPERALVQLLVETVEPDDWRETGSEGSATVYNGILVVRQHELGQQGVVQLLHMLREAGAAREVAAGAR
jgi:hypothetical protein